MCASVCLSVKPDGAIGAIKVLVCFMAAERGIEGMCLDSEGNIVACAGWKKSGGGPVIHVISAAGTILETHPAPADLPMRCAFGDAGLTSLYVTAGDGGLYRAKKYGAPWIDTLRRAKGINAKDREGSAKGAKDNEGPRSFMNDAEAYRRVDGVQRNPPNSAYAVT